MLNAMLEVESALARGRQVAVQLQHLDAQLAAARSTLGESRRRYAEGLGDYLPVLTALTTVQTIEQTRVSGQRQLLSQRVQLARALGGAWTTELEAPPLPMPEAEDGE